VHQIADKKRIGREEQREEINEIFYIKSISKIESTIKIGVLKIDYCCSSEEKKAETKENPLIDNFRWVCHFFKIF
jgi:hypothetical protein